MQKLSRQNAFYWRERSGCNWLRCSARRVARTQRANNNDRYLSRVSPVRPSEALSRPGQRPDFTWRSKSSKGVILVINRMDATLILEVAVLSKVAPEAVCCVRLARTTSGMVESLTDGQPLRSGP
jgi:hypothetical protein